MLNRYLSQYIYIYIYITVFFKDLKVDAILYARTPEHLDNIMHMTVHPSIIGVEWKLIILLLLSLSL